ncbi:MAG: DUF11 domain-containing protein, partial [Methanotrichaceae archaeon]|nr:DUF11 domain-containing protein [Methanotrichaceae archaeon]
PTKPFCVSGVCSASCTSDGQCAVNDPTKPVCYSASGRCVECAADNQCSANTNGKAVCDRTNNTCVVARKSVTDCDASLSLIETANPTTVQSHQDVTYTYIVTNTGKVPITDITVTDSLGSSFSVANLAPSKQTSLKAKHQIEGQFCGGSSRQNTTAKASGTACGKVVTSNLAWAIVVGRGGSPPDPSISINISADPSSFSAVGDLINYTYTVTNDGMVPLDSIVVTDTLGLTIARQSDTLTRTLSPRSNLWQRALMIPLQSEDILEGGANYTYTSSYIVTQADINASIPITNSAFVSAKFFPCSISASANSGPVEVKIIPPRCAGVVCATNERCCDDKCSDVLSDPENCGDCKNRCDVEIGEKCIAGECIVPTATTCNYPCLYRAVCTPREPCSCPIIGGEKNCVQVNVGSGPARTVCGISPGINLTIPFCDSTANLTPFNVENVEPLVNEKAVFSGKPLHFIKTFKVTPESNENMASLSWNGTKDLALQLFAPNGTMISPDINSNEIFHARGQHCDNYLIRDAAPGNWILKVVSLEPSSEINNFDLVTGLVVRVPSFECCIPEGNTIMMPSGEIIEPVECLPVESI